MDTQLSYVKIVKTLLKQHAEYRTNIPDTYKSCVLFDDEHQRYVVLDIGWQGDKYLHATPIHIDIIQNKIWIQFDDTEDGIASELVELGIPKEDIILGFRHPDVRVHTGFGGSTEPGLKKKVA